MVDLRSQYERLKPQIDEAIERVINSTQFVKGPEVNSFQLELGAYLGVKHVIAVGNGTDALQISLMALGLKPGDEVITPDFTFIATAEVAAVLGLKPIVVDVDWDTMNISVEAIRRAITPRTRAIVPVHLFGQCAHMEPILQIAKENNLFVVEDACQAIGSEYIFADGSRKKAGTMGHIGCTSFFPSKNLGCYGDGGAIFTDDDTLADNIRAIANHGMRVRYHHDMIGVNSRLDSLQAAILRAKLPELNDFTQRRRAVADFYDNALKDCATILCPARVPYSTHVFHQYTLRLLNGKRDEIKQKLALADIPSMIYYPVPLHRQKAYSDHRYTENDFPVSNRLADSVLSLPMHTELTHEQLDWIVTNITQ